MTNPDDQQAPTGSNPVSETGQGGSRPQGNAPSWMDDVLGSPNPGGSARPLGPDMGKRDPGTPNLSKAPAQAHDLRIPEPARPAPAAVPEDWISRVTGNPPPSSAPQSNGFQTQPQTPPRSNAPGLDAWGEPQRPIPQPPMAQADERPVRPYAPDASPAGDVAQKRLIAGLLAIFLGSLGIHKFYLGLNTQGLMILGVNIGVWVLALLVGLLTLGLGLIITLPLAGLVSSALGLLGLIEGILYLTKSDTDFQRDYLVGKKPWL
ncbi:TM2 domain-containing protein [Deinococcus humi]|uniref:TM2 domain-containing membrane protein YozV n=1 Tax=Deinococcus humi TaxID=662880 RepID=A0A7W8NHE4_9DEIO|nr:NINE protein [Deinococcus humi]MBB5364708.1 TM2 domain-containing membrane protein YozV [Deinococcus humi]GGO34332.1 hypothetical protein GCM10008949_34960 [Deinococcus humi]